MSDIYVVTDEQRELRKRGYFLGTTLGEGTFTKVKGAFCAKLRKRVAVKIINKKKATIEFQERFLPKELEVCKIVDHPNIIKTYEIMEFHNKVYVIMEQAVNGSLLDFIILQRALTEERAKVMFKQLTDAVNYLHRNNISHRDLKCENLLLDAMNNIKVSDFGLARFYRNCEISKTFCGSTAYAAPELLRGIPSPVPVHDIWSMGVILYMMLFASLPYDDSNIKKMIQEQLERKVHFPRSKEISEECKELIDRLLEVNIERRATISFILGHPWVCSAGRNGISGPGSTSHQKRVNAKKQNFRKYLKKRYTT